MRDGRQLLLQVDGMRRFLYQGRYLRTERGILDAKYGGPYSSRFRTGYLKNPLH